VLGLSSSIARSSVISTVDVFTGAFKINKTLNADVALLEVRATSVNHNVDAVEDDGLPGILLSNVVVKINGSVSSDFSFIPGNISADPASYIVPAFESANSLSFDDTDYQGVFVNATDVPMYSGVISGSAVAGDDLEISGNLTLNDGSLGPYIPGNQGSFGMVSFRLNPGSLDIMQVFLDPNFNSVQSGTGVHGARTTVGSSVVTLA
jgi:hypothetical protein